MATSHDLRPTCEECGTVCATTPTEAVCPDCQTVIEDSPLDRGPDWGLSETDDLERAKPGDRDRHDRGLGSQRGGSASKTPDERRRDRINHRIRLGDKKARNRGQATGEIQRIGAALELPDALITQAKRLFRDAHDADLAFGRDLDTLAATAVYTTCRLNQTGRSPDAVAAVAHADAARIARRHTWLCDELGLRCPPPDLAARVRVVAGQLGVDHQTTQAAVETLREMPDHRQQAGKPSTLAAALLYHVADRTQEDCADAAGVTAAALRNRLADVDGGE